MLPSIAYLHGRLHCVGGAAAENKGYILTTYYLATPFYFVVLHFLLFSQLNISHAAKEICIGKNHATLTGQAAA